MAILTEAADDGTTILVEQYWCVYPISGVYTRLQRILLYVAIVFAFWTRFHHWISSSALMFVVIYTLTASIHAIFLSVQTNLGPDPDFLATQIIVTSATCCSVMATIYSPKVFNFHADRLYRVWLCFLAIVMVIQSLSSVRFIDSSRLYTVDVKGGQGVASTDICSAFNPNVFFRSSTDTLIGVLIDSWPTVSSSYFPNTTMVRPDTSGGYRVDILTNLIIFYMAVVLPLMMIGLTNVGRPLRVSRAIAFNNFIYRRVPQPGTTLLQRVAIRTLFALESVILTIRYFIPVVPYLVSRCRRWPGDRPKREPWQYRVTVVETDTSAGRVFRGKLAGLVWYFVCLLAYWIWPGFLLYIVIAYEQRWFTSLPESEVPSEVGQWGPWVGFCLSGFIILVYRWIGRQEGDKGEPGGGLAWTMHDEAGVGRKWYWRYKPCSNIIMEWEDLRAWWRNPLKSTDSCDEALNSAGTERPG
ncbi:hypothetical protein GGS26DRAFT_589712 [Hypomontagnella submonticulosa]|nr:hypothetical protein GGS26DRAFT_589712 [Hypomontagnella submonticulosa]